MEVVHLPGGVLRRPALEELADFRRSVRADLLEHAAPGRRSVRGPRATSGWGKPPGPPAGRRSASVAAPAPAGGGRPRPSRSPATAPAPSTALRLGGVENVAEPLPHLVRQFVHLLDLLRGELQLLAHGLLPQEGHRVVAPAGPSRLGRPGRGRRSFGAAGPAPASHPRANPAVSRTVRPIAVVRVTARLLPGCWTTACRRGDDHVTRKGAVRNGAAKPRPGGPPAATRRDRVGGGVEFTHRDRGCHSRGMTSGGNTPTLGTSSHGASRVAVPPGPTRPCRWDGRAQPVRVRWRLTSTDRPVATARHGPSVRAPLSRPEPLDPVRRPRAAVTRIRGLCTGPPERLGVPGDPPGPGVCRPEPTSRPGPAVRSRGRTRRRGEVGGGTRPPVGGSGLGGDRTWWDGQGPGAIRPIAPIGSKCVSRGRPGRSRPPSHPGRPGGRRSGVVTRRSRPGMPVRRPGPGIRIRRRSHGTRRSPAAARRQPPARSRATAGPSRPPPGARTRGPSGAGRWPGPPPGRPRPPRHRRATRPGGTGPAGGAARPRTPAGRAGRCGPAPGPAPPTPRRRCPTCQRASASSPRKQRVQDPRPDRVAPGDRVAEQRHPLGRPGRLCQDHAPEPQPEAPARTRTTPPPRWRSPAPDRARARRRRRRGRRRRPTCHRVTTQGEPVAHRRQPARPGPGTSCSRPACPGTRAPRGPGHVGVISGPQFCRRTAACGRLGSIGTARPRGAAIPSDRSKSPAHHSLEQRDQYASAL